MVFLFMMRNKIIKGLLVGVVALLAFRRRITGALELWALPQTPENEPEEG